MKKKKDKLLNKIEEKKAEIDERKNGVIYQNAFEWRFQFPEVLDEKGNFIGFNVVVGNPPYLTGSSFKELHSYFNNEYKVAEYQLDLYTFFIEMATRLLRNNGTLSLITPNSWLKNLKMSRTRSYVLNSLSIVEMNPNISGAFEEAQVDTLIFSATKISRPVNQVKVWSFDKNLSPSTLHFVDQSTFSSNEGQILDVEVDPRSRKIIKKIRSNSKYFEDEFEITRGVNPYDKYRGQSQAIIKSKAYHSTIRKDRTFKPELRGKHVSTFLYKWDEKHYISYGSWLAAPRDPRFFEGSRILFREIISDRFVCTVITEDFIVDRSLYIAKPRTSETNPLFALGVLASKLLVWIFRLEKNEFDQLFPKIRLEEFKKLPFPKEVNSDTVKRIEDTVKKISDRKMDNYDANVLTLEADIDKMVYGLYDLTEEEIGLIEENI